MPGSTSTDITTYGPAATPAVQTDIGTTVQTKTITNFIPQSTAVATSAGTTYYSTYLSITSYTTCITLETTKVLTIYPTVPIPMYCPPQQTVYSVLTVTVTAEASPSTTIYTSSTELTDSIQPTATGPGTTGYPQSNNGTYPITWSSSSPQPTNYWYRRRSGSYQPRRSL